MYSSTIITYTTTLTMFIMTHLHVLICQSFWKAPIKAVRQADKHTLKSTRLMADHVTPFLIVRKVHGRRPCHGHPGLSGYCGWVWVGSIHTAILKQGVNSRSNTGQCVKRRVTLQVALGLLSLEWLTEAC